jgi:hypothetical protein
MCIVDLYSLVSGVFCVVCSGELTALLLLKYVLYIRGVVKFVKNPIYKFVCHQQKVYLKLRLNLSTKHIVLKIAEQ